MHVDGQRLERGDIKRVQPVAFFRRQQRIKGGQETRQRLARAGGGAEQHILPFAGGFKHLQLVREPFPAMARQPRVQKRHGASKIFQS